MNHLFSSLIVKFLTPLQISSNLVITKFNYLTSSFGLGNSLNLTVLIKADVNFWAKWWAASISN